jgi:predicted MFS family arabinose efflux permease
MTRNYRLFLAGQFVSLLGTWTRSVAQVWLVYRLTDSAVWLGVIAACQQLPLVVLASLGGSLADRYRRRTILVATQSASMVLSFALFALVASDVIRLPHMIAIAVLAGVVSAVDIPTRQSFVIELVGRERLTRAIAINSSMSMCAASVAPVIAGYAVKAVGEGWCFFADGASFAAVIAGLLAMRGLPERGSTRLAAARVVDGFHFVRDHADVRALLGLLAITALAGLPYGTLFPLLAHGDSRVLGGLTAASGLGALLGAIALARRPASPRRVGIACALLGALLVGFALSRRLVIELALLVPLGAATMIQVSATNSSIQMATPDALRGRVMALWAMIVMGFAPLGALVASSIATYVGPELPLAVGGAICVAAALRFMRRERTAARSRDTDSATREAAHETPH